MMRGQSFVSLHLCLILCFSLSVVYTRDIDSSKRAFITDEFIAQINAKQSTWKAGPNKFQSWSRTEIKRLMGVLPENAEQMKQLPTIVHDVPNDLPESFDARDQWPNCPTIKEVRDQGSCGSCWAVSSAAAMSDRKCIGSNGTQNAHISAEDLLTCCTLCGKGCNGGIPALAWEHFKLTGLVTGGNYNTSQGCKPYTIPACEHHMNGSRPPCQGYQPTPQCNKKCIDGYPISYEQDKHFGASAYAILPHQEQIQAEIQKNGPVVAIYMIFEDFFAYKSGVYRYTAGDMVVLHAVKIIGWGVENSTSYWLVTNTWNYDWGEKGFFKILRGTDECGIESFVAAGTSKLN